MTGHYTDPFPHMLAAATKLRNYEGERTEARRRQRIEIIRKRIAAWDARRGTAVHAHGGAMPQIRMVIGPWRYDDPGKWREIYGE